MSVQFSYDPDADGEPSVAGRTSDRFAFAYVLHVRPNQAPGADPFKSKDVLSTRLAVDSVPYRASSSHFRTVTRSFASGSLVGALALDLPAGNHTAKLQWRKSAGGSVRTWWSQPTFLDGFVTSRTLAVYRDRFPVEAATGLAGFPGAGQTGADADGSSSSTSWRQVRSGLLPLSLHKKTFIRLSYAVSLSRYGQPTFDSNTWRRWGMVSTRLVVDGRPYRSTATSLDGGVPAGESMSGTAVLALPPGDHTVVLQWRPQGEAPADWAGLLSLFDGFAGATITTSEASASNSPPRVRVPPTIRENDWTVSFFEDEPGKVEGMRVTDPDTDIEPSMEVEVTVGVVHGSLLLGCGPENPLAPGRVSLAVDQDVAALPLEVSVSVPGPDPSSPTSGAGSFGREIVLRGAIDAVNNAIRVLRYAPDLDYNGNDTLVVQVDDLGNVGSGGTAL